MQRWKRALLQWGPALGIMAVIFLLSATPSDQLPDAGRWDLLFKKGGHLMGYGLLALAYIRGLNSGSSRHIAGALLMVLLYAASDEIHQAFVSGRGSSPVDVGIDLMGALLAILIFRSSPVLRRFVLSQDNDTWPER